MSPCDDCLVEVVCTLNNVCERFWEWWDDNIDQCELEGVQKILSDRKKNKPASTGVLEVIKALQIIKAENKNDRI